MYNKQKKKWYKHLDFIILDQVCTLFSLYLGYSTRHEWGTFLHNRFYLNTALILVLLDLLIVLFSQSYKNVIRRGYLREIWNTFTHCLLLFGFAIIFFFLTKTSDQLSRQTMSIYLATQLTTCAIGRCLLKHHVRKKLANNPNNELILIITDKKRALETVLNAVQDVQNHRGYQPIGVVLTDIASYKQIIFSDVFNVKLEDYDDDLDAMIAEGHIYGIPIVCGFDEVEKYLLNNIVDSVLLSSEMSPEDRGKLTSNLISIGVVVHAQIANIDSGDESTIEKFGSQYVLTTGLKLASSGELIIKRTLDILGGIVGSLMAIIFAIIFGPIIFIQSPGPILFKQTRVGKNGRRFTIYKFRSMYLDAEERKKELMDQNEADGLMFKMTNDPRIIPIGRFIRKYSIDEFPQFFNVLFGDMSLVGTRPPTMDEYLQYEPHHKARLNSKPGITGLWQTSGRSDITDFEQVVELDVKYITTWSLGLDVKILINTVLQVFRGSGAK
ncbi:sugar transferase [Eubacterium xylanophilum]|uniref:sugar transferase n=1 Tax=Eubacterium xylanophilum TaxID=39497 RepID=UPI0004789E17|nr:sugar transferase [Eubacterium xylanophilum]